ncbi:protein-tyrosine phosphatase family protein [Allonocardiopsis opalescens]|uniref:Tyrosine specific protein phosphatases domain-containing protein n=1 Tax=Allonocardiopsis opalescens TaxID=1144618 RepID=A0A2T0PU18_9ACTN|nr:tyrosine protein phosphatase [Allonocardiopsis opalescens]PRX92288.1 hypothetical protein CLV72_11048 [Allonocardiopsis opalescens]
MRPEVFEVAAPGRLGWMARPRGGDWLDDEMAGLRGLGVDTLVCLLTRPEPAVLELEGEREAAHRAGLEPRWLPVVDRSVPAASALRAEADVPAERVEAGRFVVTHCRLGIGRSAMLAAVLVRLGEAPHAVWGRLERARGRPVPDTGEQYELVARLGRRGAAP